MNTTLSNPGGGNFKAQNVHLLTNEKATLANIRKEIDVWLPSVAKVNDRVLIYFAGHGLIDPASGKGYLAPYDIDPKNIAATGFPMEELGQVIGGKIRAKSKILLTDACHSGAITPEDIENVNHSLVKLNSSLFSMTASKDREVSVEDTYWGGGHGAFTWYVVLGMGGQADVSPRDGEVTADELAEYVHTQVRQDTGGKQNPTSEKGSFDPNLFIALVPENAPPGVPPAPKFGSLVFRSNMDDVTILVDGKPQGIASKDKDFPVPGLTPGQHTIQGVHNGYEPDGPREETVYPGRDVPVKINIVILRHRKQAAVDSLNQGMKYYLKGEAQNYKKAVDAFAKAFQIDPTYSQAAYYLARAYNSLFDEQNADKYFKKAIQIDYDNMDARVAYAGMLLDRMDADQALIQLNIVLLRQPNNVEALTHQAQAYRFKDLYPRAIESAQKAIQLAPTSGEPHLWLGDSLRLSDKDAEADVEYEKALKLTNFDSKLAGQLNYYVIGSLIGLGRRHRAAEHDIWRDLRSLMWFGLCDSERKLKDYDSAIASCQKSLSYSSEDPYAHYVLGLCLLRRADANNSVPDLDSAVKHLRQTIEINPDIPEAGLAKKNIANAQTAIEAYQKALRSQ